MLTMEPVEVISDEERLDLRHRWSAEGRRDETDFYLKEMIKSGCRVLKLSEADAKNRAYVEAKKRYTPLSPEELAAVQENRAAMKAENPKPQRQVIQADIDIEIPESWGKLPKTSPYRGCVEWVRGEYLQAVRYLPSGRIKIDLSHADPAPSLAALSLLKWAAKNENEWHKTTMPKALSGEDDPDSDNIRESEMRAQEIEQVLKKFDLKPTGKGGER